jgi:hypothetical protein
VARLAVALLPEQPRALGDVARILGGKVRGGSEESACEDGEHHGRALQAGANGKHMRRPPALLIHMINHTAGLTAIPSHGLPGEDKKGPTGAF